MSLLVRMLLSIAFLVGIATAGGAAEENGIAYVSAVRGDVYLITPDGLTKPLQVRDKISQQDFVVTEKRSRVKIVFQDNTIVTLGEESTVKLSDYRWSEKAKKGHFDITINEGFFRIIGGKITKTNPEKFVARTPAASIGIRGSSYAGNVKNGRLKVFLTSGRGIDVFNGQGRVALLSPGMGTNVDGPDSTPSSPARFQASEMYWLLEESAVDTGVSPGSVIGPNGKVINQAIIKNSVNIAIGKDNSAQMGSIHIKGSKVNGTVVNKAEISDSANIAVGSGNQAIMGATEIE